jgi:hypothetical protein
MRIYFNQLSRRDFPQSAIHASIPGRLPIPYIFRIFASKNNLIDGKGKSRVRMVLKK